MQASFQPPRTLPLDFPEELTNAARSAQDLALAAVIGGNLFGRVAMHPALTEVTDKTERGKVLNRAWRRYGAVNSLALGTLVAGWLPARLTDADARRGIPPERRLVLAKDVAMGAVLITGLASAAGGVGFSHQAPGGAVPMTSGHDPAPETPPRAARLKRAVNAAGAANLAAAVALLAVNSAFGAGKLPPGAVPPEAPPSPLSGAWPESPGRGAPPPSTARSACSWANPIVRRRHSGRLRTTRSTLTRSRDVRGRSTRDRADPVSRTLACWRLREPDVVWATVRLREAERRRG
jgi:hypothetical protein